MNGRTDGRMEETKEKKMDAWIDGWINGWTVDRRTEEGQKDRGIKEKGCIDVWMYGWRKRWKKRWMDGRDGAGE